MNCIGGTQVDASVVADQPREAILQPLGQRRCGGHGDGPARKLSITGGDLFRSAAVPCDFLGSGCIGRAQVVSHSFDFRDRNKRGKVCQNQASGFD